MNEIIHGDCLDYMKTLEDNSIDLILTDPPYGIKPDKGFGGSRGFGGFGKPIKRREYDDSWDSERPPVNAFNEMLRVSKAVIIFGGNYFADILPQSTHWLVWDKLNTMPTFSDCELIYTNIKRKSVKKYTFQYNGLIGKEEERFHPTQKPVELIKRILRDYAKGANVVYDPYAGSCSISVACKSIGIPYLASEKEAKYVEIGRKRLDAVKGIQGTLFEEQK